jgi:hypothetical protein
VSPQPTYLRPRPRPPLDPGFLRQQPPGTSLFAQKHPAFLPGPMFQPDQVAASTPRPRAAGPSSLRNRLATAVESAAGSLNPNSESGAESFFGTAVNTFARGQQMSRQQQVQQDKALEQESQRDLRAAQAEYYRGRAHVQPTRGITQADRLELENVRHGHLTERLRTAADLRRRQASHGNQGKVSQADRFVLGRTERADVGANRAVEAERTQAARGYRDPLQPTEEKSIRARIRRSIDPNYVADSTAVANLINPTLGVPRAPTAPAPNPLSLPAGVQSILENYLRSKGGRGVPASRPGQSVAPSSPAVPETATDLEDSIDTRSDEGTVDETGDELSDDEVTAALDMIADLDLEDARAELTAAGYTDPQIDVILARK